MSALITSSNVYIMLSIFVDEDSEDLCDVAIPRYNNDV